MAMPSGNKAIPDKMQFPSRGGGGGSEIHQHCYCPRYMDERDGFISWLRSEFAAANAIIDSLCHHLRAIGDPCEYDTVIGTIQQRRCNWNQVLLMQQYFSVADVVYALQQVALKRQQRFPDPLKVAAKEFKKSGPGFQQGQKGEAAKGDHNSNAESYDHEENYVVTGGAEKGAPLTEKYEEHKSGGKGGKTDDKYLASAEEKKDAVMKHHADCSLKNSGSSQCSIEYDSPSIQNDHENRNLSSIAKTFVANETFDGKKVNVVDGLKLYEGLLEGSEVSKLVLLVNDLRAAGKRGQFQGGSTYLVSKRPMKGRGREMIQLGVPIADVPPDGENRNVESIPELFQNTIDRLVASQVMTVKPDACIVDFYNEGDHSQPNNWPPWFGRPVYILFLTECNMTFGRVISSDHPGDYRGSLKLSLAPGSFLVMQGKSTDFAKHAIPTIRIQRILVTFTKSQPRRMLPSDAQWLASPAVSSCWGPPPSRSPNQFRHHLGPKPYATAPTTGVLAAPPICSQMLPPNGIQPLFVPAPVAPPMPFPSPVPMPPGSTGWTGTPPRHPPPRVPVPGTGVFLPPPGSGNSSQHLPGIMTEVNSSSETAILEKENRKSNSTSASPKGKVDGKMPRQDCNGNKNSTEGERDVEEDGQESNVANH